MRTTTVLLAFAFLALAVLSACTGAPAFESEQPLSPWAKYGEADGGNGSSDAE